MSHRGSRRELRPKPIGDKCNPLCPFFRCGQRALAVQRKYVKGRIVQIPICRLVGDKCIGAECQYAYCVKRAMLPDGRCAFAVREKEKKEADFLEELSKEEMEERSLAKKFDIDEDMI